MCSTVVDRFKPVSSVSLLVMFFYHFLIFVPILLLSLFFTRFLSLRFSSQILLSFSRRHLGYIRLVFRVSWLQTEKGNRVMCIYIFPTDLIFQPHKHLTGCTNLFKILSSNRRNNTHLSEKSVMFPSGPPPFFFVFPSDSKSVAPYKPKVLDRRNINLSTCCYIQMHPQFNSKVNRYLVFFCSWPSWLSSCRLSHHPPIRTYPFLNLWFNIITIEKR